MTEETLFIIELWNASSFFFFFLIEQCLFPKNYIYSKMCTTAAVVLYGNFFVLHKQCIVTNLTHISRHIQS